MDKMENVPQTIDEYIQMFPDEPRRRLESIRKLVRKLAPTAKEKISYRMPTFTLNRNLIHFAAFKNHIGLFPMPDGIQAFRKDLAKYKNAKGSVQFPLNEPLPLDLIARIIKYRIEKDKEKAPAPKKRAKKK